MRKQTRIKRITKKYKGTEAYRHKGRRKARERHRVGDYLVP